MPVKRIYMQKEFSSRQYWALILGGSSGLGLAAAIKLAAHGMNLCIIHRNARIEMEKIKMSFDAIRELGVQVLSFNADVTNPEKRALITTRLKEKLGDKGSIRCLLHSIAKGNLKAMTASDEPVLKTDDFQITVESMAISLYDWTQVVFSQQMFAGDARILSFTSEGSSKACRHYGAVSAAKAALEAITRSIALEFAPFGLRANCIQAGVTNTPSLQKIPDSAQLMEHSKRRNPFQRLTTPEDIANMVYLLCKDEAAWVNGAIIPVDGGEHIN